MKRITGLFITLFLCHISLATASGIPVYDASGYTQLLAQLNQMSKDYQKQVEQLEQSIRQADALTGTRNMGSLENSQIEEDLRRYLPNTWKETLDMMHAGNLGTSAQETKSIYGNLLNTYQPMAGSDIMTSDPTGPVSRSLDLKNQTTFAATGQFTLRDGADATCIFNEQYKEKTGKQSIRTPISKPENLTGNSDEESSFFSFLKISPAKQSNQ